MKFNGKIKARLAEKVTGTLTSNVFIKFQELVARYYGTFGNASKLKKNDFDFENEIKFLIETIKINKL